MVGVCQILALMLSLSLFALHLRTTWLSLACMVYLELYDLAKVGN
jgi:hypothetical protein